MSAFVGSLDISRHGFFSNLTNRIDRRDLHGIVDGAGSSI